MSTGACLELGLDDWGKQLLAPLNGQRYPLGATLDLTERCNLNCVHCYINQPANSATAQARELSTVQVLDVLDQMAAAGTLFLALTGGEPLLRPDFAAIYRAARERGMLVTVMTNATLLTPALADLLAELRPRAVEVTLYGATAETYERVTRVPGSFARCQRGLALLQERGLPLELKSVVLTINRHELTALQALAERYGGTLRYDGLLWPRLDGGTQPYAYQLPMDELLALDDADAARHDAWEELLEQAPPGPARSEYVYGCGAGLETYHVDCAGRMSICTMSRQPACSLRELTLMAAWERLGELRQLKRQLQTPCTTCLEGALCLQCPGWSQAVHGDNETPVEFVCTLARRRAAQPERLRLGVQS